MRSIIRSITILTLVPILSACASPILSMLPGGAGETINSASIAATAAAVKSECLRAPLVRRAFRDAVNDNLQAQGVANRAMALDCNGDGAPDF